MNFYLNILIKILTAAPLSIFVYRAGNYFLQFPNMALGLLFISEVLSVTFVVFNRKPIALRADTLALATTALATFYFLFFQLEQGVSTQFYQTLGYPLQIVGISLQIISKIALGRSFGLLPANRGIVSKGPYRWLRHPIYAGYLLNHLGFFMGFASIWNAGLLVGLYATQITRIFLEEKLLVQDPEYQEYCKRTRFRLIPGIW